MNPSVDIVHMIWLLGRAVLLLIAFWSMLIAALIAFPSTPLLLSRPRPRTRLVVMKVGGVSLFLAAGYSLRVLGLPAWVPWIVGALAATVVAVSLVLAQAASMGSRRSDYD